MGVAGAPSARACRCILCGAALHCRAPRCCVAVARSRTNAIVLCCGVLVCSAVLCCVHMCGVQGKSRALHNTICQRALSIVSAVCPMLRAMQHRQHRLIATSLASLLVVCVQALLSARSALEGARPKAAGLLLSHGSLDL